MGRGAPDDGAWPDRMRIAGERLLALSAAGGDGVRVCDREATDAARSGCGGFESHGHGAERRSPEGAGAWAALPASADGEGRDWMDRRADGCGAGCLRRVRDAR